MSADPIRVLEHLSPHEGWSARTDLDADPVAARILDRVLAEHTNVVSLDDARRRRRGIGGAIVVAALLAGGAVAAVWNRQAETRDRVACWSDAAVPPDELIGVKWDGRDDPVELCSARWSAGSFKELPAPDDLTACVTDDDVAAVIPGASAVCDRLGFAEFTAAPPDDFELAVRDATREIEAALRPSKNCVPLDEAKGEIRRALERFGLLGWNTKIVVAPSDDEPCVTASLDPATTTVLVAAIGRDG